MIKNTFEGFSLAELLIVLAIIAIIATMGVSISKKGVEKAYNYYIYTGYKSLQTAIGEVGTPLDTDRIKNMKNIIETASVNCTEDQALVGCVLKAQNGIIYTFMPQFKKILMEVPSPAWKDSTGNQRTTKRINLQLDNEKPEYGLIITATGDVQNILDRHDLLPFTIDDGLSGKIGKIYNSANNKYTSNFYDTQNKKRKIYSYREAFCKVHGANSNGNITCDGITQKTHTGVLKLIDPRKIF